MMNVEKHLKRYKSDKARMVILKYRLSELEGADGVKGISYDSERVQTSPKSDNLEIIAIKNIEEQEKLAREIKVLEDRIIILEMAIEPLTEQEKRIIELRYFDGLMQQMVADVLCISVTTLKKYIKDIIGKIEETVK